MQRTNELLITFDLTKVKTFLERVFSLNSEFSSSIYRAEIIPNILSFNLGFEK